MQFLWILSLSLVLSLTIVGLVIRRFSQQFLDLPNERSSHTQPTPRGGGIGFVIASGITTAVAVSLGEGVINDGILVLILLPLGVIGFLDDRYNLSALTRYGVQFLTGAACVGYFGYFPLPGLVEGNNQGAIIASILTVIGVTAMINFYNFMDGLDGLVAGCSAVQIGFLAIYLGQPLLWLWVAALVGFLYWNWSPAKIFMGDVGSTVLGALVAISLIRSQELTLGWSALVITLPLTVDAIYTLTVRLLLGENIFQAHRSHLYQRLQKSGYSHAMVSILYIVVNLLFALAIYYFRVLGCWLSLGLSVILLVTGELVLKQRLESSAE